MRVIYEKYRKKIDFALKDINDGKSLTISTEKVKLFVQFFHFSRFFVDGFA